jgi:hypothetical protein
MVQGAFRGNLVYVGLPIILYSLAESSNINGGVESLVIIIIAFSVPIYNIAAVVVLLAGRHQFDTKAIKKMFRGIVTNPLLLACVAGILYNLLFESLNPIIYRTCSAIGQMALPVALFSIGATLFEKKIGHNIIPAFAGAVIKITISPLAGIIFGNLLGLNTAEMRVVLLLLTCPAAVSSHIMAEQMIGRQNLSASIVVISTMLSIFSFSLILAFF